MKKFSLICESNEIFVDPKMAFDKIIEYMEGDELHSFLEYMMDYIELDYIEDEIPYEKFRDEVEMNVNYGTFDQFQKIMEKYDVSTEASHHIYFYVRYLEDLTKNLRSTEEYVVKLNQD